MAFHPYYFRDREQDPIVEHQRRFVNGLNLQFRLRDLSDPLDMTIKPFTAIYRIPQDVFLKLVQILEPFQTPTLSRKALAFYMIVLANVFYFSSGGYQRHLSTSAQHPMGQATVCNAIEEIVSALNHPAVSTGYVGFPCNTCRTNNRLGLPDVLGTLDSTLLRIFPPP
ncbi:Putative nuclease [Frankliniella fusca]|uniref:Nuclease n=1 Tax=Frankliniella fusca TaxID=407009 RepID=A0AAE1GW78_9NEOP|nr:Putative nuclease [Frankliniella fusca]